MSTTVTNPTATARHPWVLAGAIVFAALALALAPFLSRPSAAVQDRTPAPAAAGRYQMTFDKGEVYLLDTATGKVWWTTTQRYVTANGEIGRPWKPLIPPVVEERKGK